VAGEPFVVLADVDQVCAIGHVTGADGGNGRATGHESPA
jgi:hypothetical protein